MCRVIEFEGPPAIFPTSIIKSKIVLSGAKIFVICLRNELRSSERSFEERERVVDSAFLLFRSA